MSSRSSNQGALVLVRHGESTWNESRLVQGQKGEAPLTAKGIEQVRTAVGSLRGSSFDAILSSDLDRAVQTSRILAEALGLEITVTASLRERSFGVFEGGPLAELPAAFTGIEDGVVVDDQARPRGGESLAELYERVAVVVEQILTNPRESRLLLVTHGGPIRAIRAYCAGVTMKGLAWDVVDNASVWRVDPPMQPM
jgi:broad specificity phosphatase PhoE